MKREIFNEEALARLRSPEQLDEVITITHPIAWMAVFTVFFLVVSIVIWSIFGVMTVSVQTVGMILDPAGIVNVYHDTSGKISEVLVQPGNRVSRGDVIARLALPSMMNDIVRTRHDITRSMNQNQVEGNISQFDSLINMWRHSFNVVSTFDGIVTEVKVNVGDIVSAGSTMVCSIRLDQGRQDIMAVMYVPAESGKRIDQGMVAHLVPSGADQEEDGSLIGVVRDVSLFPVTNNGVMRTLGNPDVVNWIFQRLGGAVVEVRVDLVRDPKSPSGYLWSSSVGNQRSLTVGTVSTGSIVTDRQSPLSRMFKKLSQWLRSA